LILFSVIYSSERLKRKLGSYIDERTSHDYQLTVSDIHFNPFTGKLSLDSLRLTNRHGKENYFTLQTGKIIVNGILTDLLFSGTSLTISKLQIISPLIEVYSESSDNPERITKEELAAQLQTFFNETIKKIEIRKIEIKDAAIKYDQRSGSHHHPFRSIHNIDVVVTGFYTDSEMILRQEELFQTDEINLKIRNFNRILGDNLHQVHLDEVIYSTLDQKVTGKNIRLFPVDTMNRSGTLYWVKIPVIEMDWNTPVQLKGNDTINIKTLNLKQNEIRIRPAVSANSANLRDLRDFDLYQLFRNDFQLLTIDHLSLEDTKMRIDSRNRNDSIFQEFKTIAVHMNGFRLDSAAWTDPEKILYSDNFKLSIGSYLLKFNDHVHQFSAADIFASSTDSLIQAGSIKLVPENHKIKLPATVNLSCDSVRLLSVDFARLFHHREMPLQEIAAFKPIVSISQFGKPAAKNKDHQSLLYYFIGNYIKGVYARIVAIEDGHLAIHNLQDLSDTGIIEAGINFTLTDFSIDSITAFHTEKLFYATNLDLSFSDYNMKLADEIHRLQIDRVNVSSEQKLISIKDLNLFPDSRINIPESLERMKRTELYHIKIPNLTLHNTDINRAFFSKKLIIKDISINNPDIYLELFGTMKKQEKEFDLDEFYDLLDNYLTHIEIEKIDASDGQLRLVNHSRKGKTIDLTNRFNVHLDHFVLNDDELNKNRLLFSDHFNLTLKDHLFKLSDNVHVLKAKELNLSSRNATVSVSDALLYPLISSPAYRELPWHLLIRIPLIRLEQVDMKQIYFDQILHVGSISIDSPVIEFYRNLEKIKLNFKDPAIPLPEEMKEFTVGEASLKKGKLRIYRNTSTQQKLIAGSDLDFLIREGSLKRSANIPTAKFSSGNIETKLTGLYFNPENIPYSVDIKQIDFSSQKKLLQFTDLDIRSTDTDQEKVIAGIRIPHLRFEQLDPVDAFQNNRFHAGLIYSDKPVFTLNVKEEKNNKNPLYIKLPADIQPLMDELSAEKVTIEDASFIFQQKNKKREYDHLSVTLDGFRLDSIQSEKPLGADNLIVFKDGNQFTDKKKHYDFQVDRISFSSLKNTFSLSGIRILPRYSREAYQRIIRYQTDYYTGKIEKIDLSGIDLDRWFEKHELKAKTALITHPQIDIYRDKRIPFNEKQFKPMPQKLIRQIDLPFYFDSVNIAGAAISYAEHPENLSEPGIVRFSELNAHLFPFTNMNMGKDHDMTLSANSVLMNSSTLNVQMDFNMSSPTFPFKVKGSLSPFQLEELNPVTEYNAQVMIQSGQLNRFDFNFQADSLRAVGKLWFAYNDLRISILEQKNGDVKEAKWLSFLANSFMLKSKNPRTKILEPNDIYFERDPKRSIINYWWKTIFSGAKNTIGIKNEEQTTGN
jgi:hypothetical protein